MGNGTIPCFDHARNDDRGFFVGNSWLQPGWVLSPTSALRTPGCQARDSRLQKLLDTHACNFGYWFLRIFPQIMGKNWGCMEYEPSSLAGQKIWAIPFRSKKSPILGVQWLVSQRIDPYPNHNKNRIEQDNSLVMPSERYGLILQQQFL